MLKPVEPKLKIMEHQKWPHHRSGWGVFMEALQRHLEHNNGNPFYPNDLWKLIYGDESQNRVWIGCNHMTPSCFFQVRDKFKSPLWLHNKRYCKGIFVFSEYAAKAARQFMGVPVGVLSLPTENASPHILSDNPDILFVGHWLRRYDRFFGLQTNLNKVLLKCLNVPPEIPKEIKVLDYVSNQEYDELLSRNIVFVDFEDTSCNNIIVECIVRNTPVFAPRIDPVVEYLGEDYPLLFENREDAESKLDATWIARGYEYLRTIDKRRFSINACLRTMVESDIYQSL